MPTFPDTNYTGRFYDQHYRIKADLATVEEAKRKLPGIEEIQEDTAECLIRYVGDADDLKGHFGEGSVRKRELEDNDDKVLCMKEVGSSRLKFEKVDQQ